MILIRVWVILSIVAALFGLPTASAEAEWKVFYQSDEGQKKYYFDPESVVRSDKKTVQVRYKVMNAKEEDSEVEISNALVEITCKPKSYRILEETRNEDSNNEPVKVVISRHSISVESVIGTLWTNLCP